MDTSLFVKRALGPHRYLSALLAILSLIVISSVAAAAPDLLANGSSGAVPEPATLGLLALGLAGVGLFRRRRALEEESVPAA